ncbi:glycosyltransferase family 4 protein, partial [Buttiauxella noackiae]|uniref:glycosyltransferase family 4 protein n=1 Tax=Buttiauxella noackiae TaxID=82992 RepID=UPI0035A6C91E
EYYKDYSKRQYGLITDDKKLLRISSIEIIAKVDSLLRKQIRFDENLGLGTEYPCCEENNFLIDNYKKGAKIVNLDITPVLHTTKREHRLIATMGHYRARGYTASRFNSLIKYLLIIRWSLRIDKNVPFRKRVICLIKGVPRPKHLHIISPYESPAEARGTRNIHLAKIQGTHSTLVCTRFSHGKKKILPQEYFKDKHSFNLKTLFTIAYNKNLSVKRMFAHWITAFSVFFYILINTKQKDKILVSSIPPEVLVLSLLISKMKKIDCVIDVRDIWPDAFPLKGVVANLFYRYCATLYKIAFRIKPCKFIYVAPSFKKWIEKYCPAENIVDMRFGPLGYDEKRWASLASKSPEWLNTNRIKLVYVGYLESQFDITDVIKVVNKNVKYELLIIGNGSKQSYYQDISYKNERITFLGLLSPTDVSEKMKDCHVGVLPISKTAQMPNKLFDYLGAKLPILTIGDSDSAHFVIEKNIGWSCGFSETEVSKTLNEIDLNMVSEKYLKMLELGHEFSKENNYFELINYIINDN